MQCKKETKPKYKNKKEREAEEQKLVASYKQTLFFDFFMDELRAKWKAEYEAKQAKKQKRNSTPARPAKSAKRRAYKTCKKKRLTPYSEIGRRLGISKDTARAVCLRAMLKFCKRAEKVIKENKQEIYAFYGMIE